GERTRRPTGASFALSADTPKIMDLGRALQRSPKTILERPWFDTDDWKYRVTTLVQMVGVIILALGLPPMFASIDHGTLDNGVMVLGYVVMRLAMVAQWLRAARQS